MHGNSRNGIHRLANIVISIFTASIIGSLAWLGASVIELREFAAQGHSFTAQDAEQLRSEIERHYPPKWLVNDVRNLQIEAKRLQLQIDRLEEAQGYGKVRPYSSRKK